MHTEFKVLEVRRGRIVAQRLDGVRPELLKIGGASTLIENEVIIAQPRPQGNTSGAAAWELIASRVDPSFIGDAIPQLVDLGDGEYEFARYVGYEEGEAFEAALEILRAGDYEEAARQLRAFIGQFPYDIDSYHHLGIIETERRKWGRALKYFEMGYRIGLLTVPAGFAGQLPWLCLGNRPFLRAAHGYALALERERRHVEAVDLYEQILAWNPNDNQGIRYLLPSVYLEAKAPQKARAALEQHGADGMNLYTRCLLEIQDGRRREALRWLCRALDYNMHLPSLVLSPTRKDRTAQGGFVIVGSPHEAATYLRDHQGWMRKQPRDFLRRVLAVKPFAQRVERAIALRAALDAEDGLPPGHIQSATATELGNLFSEEHIPQILEECREAL